MPAWVRCRHNSLDYLCMCAQVVHLRYKLERLQCDVSAEPPVLRNKLGFEMTLAGAFVYRFTHVWPGLDVALHASTNIEV